MISNLYTIYDVVAREAGPVFNAKNDGVAIRQYQYLMAGDGGNPVKNPEDYHLYRVASFDPETMVVKADREQLHTSVQLPPQEV